MDRAVIPGGALALAVCLSALLAGGCGKPPGPFASQVNRAVEASLQGQELLSEGQDQRAEKAFTKSLQISRSIDNPTGTARQLNNLGAVALTRGESKEAQDLFQQALARNRGLGDTAGAAINLANLATIAQTGGNLPQAEAYLQEALGLARQSGSSKVLGQVLCQLAGLALDRQDIPAAASWLHEAQPARREAEVRGSWNYQQGRLSLARGNPKVGRDFFLEALAADRAILNRPGMGADLQGLGQSWEDQGDFGRAFLYYGRAFDLYATTGRTEKARLCLAALRRVNQAGGLGRSLQPFEEELAGETAAAPSPTPAKPAPSRPTPPPPDR